MKFYTVAKGRVSGIYDNWTECQKQIDKFKGAVYKSFSTLNEAIQFYKNTCSNQEPKLHFGQNLENKKTPTMQTKNESNTSTMTEKKDSKTIKKRLFSDMQAEGTKNQPIDLEADSISLETIQTLQFKKPEEIVPTTIEEVEILENTEKESSAPSPRTAPQTNSGNFTKSGTFEENYPKLAKEFHRLSSSSVEIPKMRLWDSENVAFVAQTARKTLISKNGGEIKYTVCYTDGACSGNGKKIPGKQNPAGSGAFFENEPERSVSQRFPFENPTNQRAELFAIFLALAECKPEESLEIISDSSYSIDCITKWSKKWENNSFKDAKGEDVKNQDLLKPILRILGEKNGKSLVKFTWIKGHDGHVGNETADYLARLSIGAAVFDENMVKRRRIE